MGHGHQLTLQLEQHSVLLDYVGKKVTVDETEITISGSSTSKFTGCLGSVGKYGTNVTFIGKVYAVKVWRNGSLIHDYAPVRVGSVGYMYDNVTGAMIGNAGTGTSAPM